MKETMVESNDDEVVDGTKSLAFTSIATDNFQFDHEMAADIIVASAIEFLLHPNHAQLRLVLVDSINSDMLDRVSAKASEVLGEIGLPSLQLFIHTGDITRLFTSGGPRCNFIANATNWCFKPGGSGVNAAIFEAAGYELELATKQFARSLQPGEVVAIPLPASSPLRRIEGVTHIIHVLGPNMNPWRPNFLSGDYKQGCEILRNAYSRLFMTFSSLALKDKKNSISLYMPLAEHITTQRNNDISNPTSKNTSPFLIQSTKKKASKGLDFLQREDNLHTNDALKNDEDVAKENLKIGSNDDMGDNIVMSMKEFRESNTLNFGNAGIKTKSSKHKNLQKWEPGTEELREIALNPEKYSGLVLEVTSEAVVIFDKFAKGKKHLLVISREDGLDTIEDVHIKDLPILKHMHSLGEAWARQYIKEDSTLIFRLGYHWVPCMRQLHMHVISQDFDSPNLNTKRHWNSFTTGFFRDSEDVLAEVQERGQIMPCGLEIEGKFMSMELRCHRCRSAQPSMPRLKTHLPYCKSPLERPSLISRTCPRDQE